MATENILLRGTVTASADLTAAQYKIVTGAGALAGAGAGGWPIQNAPASGQPAEVVLVGKAKVLLGGTVAAGGKVASNASGLGVAATTGNTVIGTALTAGVSGDVIEVVVPGQALA